MPTPSPKHDTVFQSNDRGTPDNWSQLVLDQTGRGNDLTEGADHGSLLSAAAGDFAADGESNITIRANINEDNTGFLYCRRDADQRHALNLIAADSIRAIVNGTVEQTVALPGSFPSPGGDDFVISWSGRANPLTTGASDAHYNELRIWNETDGVVAGASWTGETPSLGGADLAFGARDPAGNNSFDGEVIDIAYSTRFHSTTETHANWIATPSAPTLDGDAPIEVPTPNVDSGFGDQDWLVGPTFSLGAAGARRNGPLVLSPLLNSIPMLSTGTFLDDVPDPSRWSSDNVPSAGADAWNWIGQFTYYPSAGVNFNRLKCWVHLQIDGPFADDSFLRIYSMNAHPDSLELAIPGEPAADSLEYFHAQVTMPSAQTDGAAATGGAWYEFDPIKIARAPGDEHTLIAVALLAGDPTLSWRIRALHVEPLIVAPDAGDIDFG